jgi:hypothetical protein
VIDGFQPAAEPLHVEGETRLFDAQAQFRRIALKTRDGAVGVVLLVVADTPRNRASVRAAGSMIIPSRHVRRCRPSQLGSIRVGRRSSSFEFGAQPDRSGAWGSGAPTFVA